MGAWYLIGTCVVAAGIAACVVRWFLGRFRPPRRGGLMPASCVCTFLCLVSFAVALVFLMVLVADTNDKAGDATLYAVERLEAWLIKTLRP